MAESAQGSALGVRAIVAYKFIKGLGELVLALTLVVLLALGLAPSLRHFAAELRYHVSRAWSVRLAELVMRGATRRGIELTSLALTLDGVLTVVEGWALRRGHVWGPWLVVAATGGLLPFEVYQLVRHVRVSHVLALGLNLLIVVYLAHRALREHRARRR
jgi:uncharacterized membrane protein (DUF2068 family)